MKSLISVFIFILVVQHPLLAQQNKGKKPLDFTVYDGWKVIDRPAISNDGKWVTYEINPYQGDGELVIMNPDKLIKKVFQRGSKANFSPGSNYAVFNIVPQKDTLRQLKLKKVKKDKFPKDTLGIWLFKEDKTIYITNLNICKVPEEKSDWMAYMHDFVDESNDKSDKKELKKNGKKPKDMPDVYDLVIANPLINTEYRFKDVSEFSFSRNGKLVGFIQHNGDSVLKSKVSIFNTEKQDINKIFEAEGLAKKIILDNAGTQGAFIFSTDSTKNKIYSLYFWSNDKKHSSEIVIDTNSLEMPKDWVVSEYGDIWFSRDDSKMYFGTALKPEPEPQDTLLDEEKVKVDVWSWTDPLIQSQQLVEIKKEFRRNYLTVYHTKIKRVARLSNEIIPEINTLMNGNAPVALGIADKSFQTEQSWQYPFIKDYYLVNVSNGNKQIILEKTTAETGLSPFGKFLFWFDSNEKAWFVKNTRTQKILNVTSKLGVNFFDEEYDLPTEVPAYGYAGWTENDSYFLVYDRFDIWKIDPTGKLPAVKITYGEGRKNNIQLRYISLDEDLTYIGENKDILLRASNTKTKQSGFYTVSVKRKQSLKKLIFDDFSFYPPTKAKNANKLVWRKSSVKQFPDLWYSGTDFSDPLKISYANPQQEEYNWATAELVKWTTFDGKQEEGLLYKPENFDPNKKYPMLVYFYDLKSDELHLHYYPKPSRSTINVLFYASNEYLVFLPNIRYEIGYPGKSAYNYIVSGTKAMIEKGFVDEKNIGLQGQSWGGYQVAYLVTQTNMYKAASAGSPVSNMTSAYGGIRTESGMSRMYQYENTQSRIGATLWEKPDLYIKNSPLFYADKIETPLLIRHNDADGGVPWEQGIELFLAMRRLNKPVWLLNYNDEPHNLRDKSPDCKDLSIRMFQFFNHYLKGAPMPVWLKQGIPAIKKGKTLGYDLIESHNEDYRVFDQIDED